MAVKDLRKIRHIRIRNRIAGKGGKPRLSVFRSNKHIYAQIIDDSRGHTLISVSTRSKDLRAEGNIPFNKDTAFRVGEFLAKKAGDMDIDVVCFDRGGYKYHGKVKALAEGARKGGLKF